MPIILLKGRIKHKAKVRAYVEHLCKDLGINRMWSKVLFIRFHTSLKHESQGLCWGDRNEGYVEIDIARTSNGEDIPYETIMQTLAHEMVHAKQYLRGELDGWTNSWKGRKPRNYKYENAPWEKEAYKLEMKLYENFWL